MDRRGGGERPERADLRDKLGGGVAGGVRSLQVSPESSRLKPDLISLEIRFDSA